MSVPDDAGELVWTISLRRLPASLGDDHPADDRAVLFELVCRWCGDDPTRGYRQVPAELQRIRGLYLLPEGIEAFVRHEEVHGGADPGLESSRPGRPGASRDLP